MAIEFMPLVAKYGYSATFVGTLLEGETFLVFSGVAASRGYLELPVLFVVGMSGAMLADNFFFVLGRAFGPALFGRFPRLAPAAARAHAVIERFPNSAVIGIRFWYGMRSVGPAIIGTGSMPWSRFVALDAIAASLWSCGWTRAGYVLGEAAGQLQGELGQFGRWMFVGLVAGTAIVLLIVRLRRRNGNPPNSGQRPEGLKR